MRDLTHDVPDRALVPLLIGVTALGPFAIQVIAPGIPQLGDSLGVGRGEAQLFLTLATLGTVLGAIFYGPLADYYGRRPVLIWGLLMACFGGVLAAAAPGYDLAIVGRMIQSAGSACGMVLARAIAHDRWGRDGAAKMLARIIAVMVIAPMLAPTIGGFITDAFGWRAVFATIAFVALGLAIWVWTSLNESLLEPADRLDIRSVMSDYRQIAGLRRFWSYAGWSSCSISIHFFFIGAAPLMFASAFGLGPAEYGLYYIAVPATFIVVSRFNPAVTTWLGAERTIFLGSTISLGGALLVTALFVAGLGSPALLIIGGALQSVGAALGQSNSMAGAVSAAPQRAGTASSLVSISMFGLAGVSAQAASAVPEGAVWLVPGGMALIALAGLCLFLTLRSGPWAPDRISRS
ncbi:MAG: multidrug effflux MFS transporter [Pseudomonadota bacterium]